MSGGGGDVTQTREPPAFLRPYIQDVLSRAGQQVNRPSSFFPGNTVAGMPDNTQEGINSLAGFGDSAFNQQTLQAGQSGLNTLANQQFNPALMLGTHQAAAASPFITGLFQQAQQQGGGPIDLSPNVNAIGDPGGFQGINVPGSSPFSIEQTAGQVSPVDTLNSVMQRSPGDNQFVQDLVNRTLGAQSEEFRRGVLPGIQNQAQAGGAFGGSRQGVAEGVAAGDLARHQLGTAASIFSDQFNQDSNRQLAAAGQAGALQQAGAQTGLARTGQDRQFGLAEAGLNLNAQGQNRSFDLNRAGLDLNTNIAERQFMDNLVNQALMGTQTGTSLLGTGIEGAIRGGQGAAALAPSIQSAGLTGAQTQLAAGDMERSFAQQLIDAERQRHEFEQAEPLQRLQNYSNIVSQQQGGFGSTTQPGPQTGGFSGAIGGAATGAGMSAALTQAGVLTAGSGWGWGLIALGALAGAMG